MVSLLILFSLHSIPTAWDKAQQSQLQIQVTAMFLKISCKEKFIAETGSQLQVQMSANALAVIKEQSRQTLNFSSDERTGNVKK